MVDLCLYARSITVRSYVHSSSAKVYTRVAQKRLGFLGDVLPKKVTQF